MIKRKIFQEARDFTKGIKEKMKERRKQILDKRWSKLEESCVKKAEEKERIAQKKVSLLLEIDKYGDLWKNTHRDGD